MCEQRALCGESTNWGAVIPKEIRRTLRIREGDPQQTALEGDAQEDAQMLLALLAGVIEQRKKYA